MPESSIFELLFGIAEGSGITLEVELAAASKAAETAEAIELLVSSVAILELDTSSCEVSIVFTEDCGDI